jgi:hypothetical protein
MAAFVVAPDVPSSIPRSGTQLNIFPGSATPAVFAAGTPFWIGSGFVPAADDPGLSGTASLERTTRFELDVDGEPVPLDTDVTREGGRVVRTLAVVSFDSGLPPGWHRFTARWYVDGKLLLANDASIEFVEP